MPLLLIGAFAFGAFACGEDSGSGMRRCLPGCLKDSCGFIQGCDGTIACGDCEAPLTCGGGGEANVCGAPRAPAKIARVELLNWPDNEVRQGAGIGYDDSDNAEPIIMAVYGENLAGDSLYWDLPEGGVPRPVDPSLRIYTIPGESDENRRLAHISVPRGSALGTVFIHTKDDPTRVPAFRVTEITVCPSCRDPVANGSEAHPFATVGEALRITDPYLNQGTHRVHLREGTYTEADWGPAMPVGLSTSLFHPRDVRSDTVLRGDGPEKTKIVAPSAASGLVGLMVSSTATVEDLEITGFDVGAELAAGGAHLKNVVVAGSGSAGVRVRSNGALHVGRPELESVVVRDGKGAGVLIDDAALDIKGGRITGNAGWGVEARAPRRLAIEGSEIGGNGGPPSAEADGGGVGLRIARTSTRDDGAEVSLTRVNVHDNGAVGIDAESSMRGRLRLRVTDSQIRGHARHGIRVGAQSELLLSGTTVALARDAGGRCTGDGLFLDSASARANLLPNASGVGNTFALAPRLGGEATDCYGIVDARPAGAGPITVRATTFESTAAPLSPPTGCSASANDRKWTIQNPGSCPDVGNVVIVP